MLCRLNGFYSLDYSILFYFSFLKSPLQPDWFSLLPECALAYLQCSPRRTFPFLSTYWDLMWTFKCPPKGPWVPSCLLGWPLPQGTLHLLESWRILYKSADVNCVIVWEVRYPFMWTYLTLWASFPCPPTHESVPGGTYMNSSYGGSVRVFVISLFRLASIFTTYIFFILFLFVSWDIFWLITSFYSGPGTKSETKWICCICHALKIKRA